MIVKVHMLSSFHERFDKIRNVKVSDLTNPTSVLDEVYYKGQNDFADTCDLDQDLPSVSVGDVIEYPDGVYHLIKMVGFRKINSIQFLSYQQHMSLTERQTITHFFALGD